LLLFEPRTNEIQTDIKNQTQDYYLTTLFKLYAFRKILYASVNS